ncbi:MAG TPA: thioesterase family protein [Kiritimatiellia bacterium]|nr:thioesterase family protein [Kiritimatiellia bacterium]
MARVKIELPPAWGFTTDIPIRITDINYGNHMGNDAFLGILHETRMRWLKPFGWTELIFDRIGLIMVDIAVRLKSQAVYGDILRVSLAAVEPTKLGFDLIYQATHADSGAEVARAQTGMIFFDYDRNKLTAMPDRFRERIFQS